MNYYRTLFLRYSSFCEGMLCFLHYTVRFLNGTVSFVNGTMRFECVHVVHVARLIVCVIMIIAARTVAP